MTDDSAVLRFPADFRFGVATAAHQVEGHNVHSDWWEFEQRPGVIAHGDRSGAACDHYRLFREDLDLIRELSLDSYRFSIEWARIEPEPGRFDPAALEHYAEVIAACRERGVEPFVTLYHFTLPRWFAAAGGWESPDAPTAFERYARFVGRGLKGLVTYWTTINEPSVYLVYSYVFGIWPPAARDFRRMIRAGRNLVRAHFLASAALRETPAADAAGPRVGVAKHLRVFDPLRPRHRLDRWAAGLQDNGFNWSFPDSVATRRFQPPLGVRDRVREAGPDDDYVGINYYSRDRVRFRPLRPAEMFGERVTTPGAPVNDLGWEIYPEGLARMVRADFARYGKPIYVTENGIADATDARRPAFLVEHLAVVARLIREGLPVKGYFNWTLMDNFEWAEGYAAKFGLVETDFATQERRPRASARLYAEIAERREIPAELRTRHTLTLPAGTGSEP